MATFDGSSSHEAVGTIVSYHWSFWRKKASGRRVTHAFKRHVS
jgi:hypothetical protein